MNCPPTCFKKFAILDYASLSTWENNRFVKHNLLGIELCSNSNDE